MASNSANTSPEKDVSDQNIMTSLHFEFRAARAGAALSSELGARQRNFKGAPNGEAMATYPRRLPARPVTLSRGLADAQWNGTGPAPRHPAALLRPQFGSLNLETVQVRTSSSGSSPTAAVSGSARFATYI